METDVVSLIMDVFYAHNGSLAFTITHYDLIHAHLGYIGHEYTSPEDEAEIVARSPA
jgi:hypothetical protein